MKRILAVIILLTAGLYVFADDEVEMYRYLYSTTNTVAGRLAIIKMAANSEPEGAGDFYAEALNHLITNQANLQSATDREASDESALLLTNLLGKEKYTAAANNVWRVADSFPNPLVKAEALMALGSMQATAFLPQVIAVLNSQNMAPTSDPDMGEKLAYGAIVALEKYQDPSGYLPVFFASIGWYSDRIKDTAKKSLSVISGDPSEPLTQLIRSSAYTYQAKYDALRAIDTSDVSNDVKTGIALAAYQQGWGVSTSMTRDRMLLNTIRKYAMGMIKEYKTEEAAVYPLLERSYKEGTDWEEKLGAVSTLSTLATENAAQLLTNFLLTLNGRRQSGLTNQDDERIVREVIPALSATNQAIGRRALQAVASTDAWPSVIRRLAEENLAKIK